MMRRAWRRLAHPRGCRRPGEAGERTALGAIACLLAGGYLILAAHGALAASPSDGREAQLLHLLKHDCGSCHGLTLKGGLGPALLPAALADKDSEHLVEVVLEGVPGTPMPPWRFELSRGEATWLIARLKQGVVP
jgi:cytochrome c55X